MVSHRTARYARGVNDWVDRTSWWRRPDEFGELVRSSRGDVWFEVPGGSDELWNAWMALPPQRNVLCACERHRVRYAAIDFAHQPLRITGDPASEARLATWGSKLTWVGELLLDCVPPAALALFTSWTVYVDVACDLRVGFSAPPQPGADAGTSPQLLALAIGRALSQLAIDARSSTKVGDVIARCKARRFDKLDLLRAELRLAGAQVVPPARVRPSRLGFDSVEQGLGYVALGDLEAAHERFRAACDLSSKFEEARELLAWSETRTTIGSWSDLSPRALEREHARDFAGALALYRCVRPDPADAMQLDAAVARCHLAIGDAAQAIEPARRVLAGAPHDGEMFAVLVRAQLQLGRIADALATADARLAHVPDDALAHYARGRGLLRLGRLHEARAALERASALDPKLLEAQLLAREVDRAILRVRSTAGAPSAMSIDVPEQLAGVRELVAANRIDEAIGALAAHPDDAVAQRLRGELLAFTARFADALAAFDASLALADTPAARLGRGRALLELGRPSDALASFEAIDLPEALDGRARALLELGRHAEAEAAARAAVAAIERGSDLRARVARE